MYLLNWDQACADGATWAGGKGWNLARLHRYRFAVPVGGVVSAAAYRLFAAHPDLYDRLQAAAAIGAGDVGAPAAAALLEQLRSQMESLPLPAAVAGELHAFLFESGLLATPVAVRSSATAEDSAAASFAGIHQSFLNVTGLPEVTRCLKRCYASLWTPQAVAYRRRLGLDDDDVAAAVVIVQMIPARSAGVAFSCNPRTGAKNRFAVSAALGLGESVVGGAVTPDEYLVDMAEYPPTIADRRIGAKRVMTVTRKDGGTESVGVDPGEAALPSLTDPQIVELSLLVGRVMDALGDLHQMQDVEWAHDGRQFWLLQARPVTSLPPATFPQIADQPVTWSNGNLRDVIPGVQSALGWSVFRDSLDRMIRINFQTGGRPYEDSMNWVRLFEGRAYFNLSAMQWAAYDCLGLLPRHYNETLGGHQPELAVPPATLAEKLRRSANQTRYVVGGMRAMQGAPALNKRLWDWAESAEREPLAGLTREQIRQKWLESKPIFESFFTTFMRVNGMSGGTLQELIKLLEIPFGERASGLATAMLAGASGATSAEHGERLALLGNVALEEPAARAFFAAPDWRPLEWETRLTGTRFASEFATYLREFGHRGVYEVEIMNPRWREDPTYLLDVVRSQVLAGRTVKLEGVQARREGAWREVFGKLGFSPRGLKARFFLAQAARSAALRELSKSTVVKLMGVSRIRTQEVGRRLAAEGLLECPEDVFHLTAFDLDAYLARRSGPEGFKALATDRKALREVWLQKEPPDIIVGEKAVKMAPLPAASGPVLSGMGVAAGRAAGKARIILHPDQGSRLQPGEVLVAPSTDPAWTPLFLRAAAVVTEVGGYLSHGAIVAREYGLPAVVNVPGLLATLEDGEEITVDGNLGKVYRSRK